MLDKKISVSEQVANLHDKAQIIFTWAIPHADDLGLLPFAHRSLKALVVPMMDIDLETFGTHAESIVYQGLWEIFTHGKDKYYRIPKFCEHQTLKKDRKPSTYLFDVNSWQDAEDIGFRLEDTGNPTELKGREKKGRELKYTPEFDRVWNSYPKKIGKAEAFTSFTNLKPDEALTTRIIASIARYQKTSQWQDNDGRYIPHCTTFLNQRRFEDEVFEEKINNGPKILRWEQTAKGARPIYEDNPVQPTEVRQAS